VKELVWVTLANKALIAGSGHVVTGPRPIDTQGSAHNPGSYLTAALLAMDFWKEERCDPFFMLSSATISNSHASLPSVPLAILP